MKLQEYAYLAEMQEKDLHEYLTKYADEKMLTSFPFPYDKDNGKYVIKRKITELRKTLLNIEKAL